MKNLLYSGARDRPFEKKARGVETNDLGLIIGFYLGGSVSDISLRSVCQPILPSTLFLLPFLLSASGGYLARQLRGAQGD